MDMLVRKAGGWIPATAVSYGTESEFQALVQETFESTLAGDVDRPVVVAREVSTPENGRIDVVAVDQDGIITLCECKLDKNAGSRREVLGQILEYGGSLNGMRFADLRRLMSNRLGIDLVDAMRERAGEDFDPVGWEEAVNENLRLGRLRLVIAVDQLTEVLKQTVLFLNERASFSLVVAELRRIAHEGVEILAPSLFGDEAAQRKLPRRTPSPTVRGGDTVVVAARIALPEFERFGAYICQPKRGFREEAVYLGFYGERTIHPIFPAIVERRMYIPFTQESIAGLRQGSERDRQVAEVIQGVLKSPIAERNEGERQQVILLDTARGFSLERSIRHNGTGAWTQSQRYTKSEVLKRQPETTDDLASMEG
jgi:hypothetical protein